MPAAYMQWTPNETGKKERKIVGMYIEDESNMNSNPTRRNIGQSSPKFIYKKKDNGKIEAWRRSPQQ